MTDGDLSEYDEKICRLFAYLVRTGQSKEKFAMLPFAYPDAPDGFFHSEYTIRSRAKDLAGIKPKHYNCCIKSCVCYAGIYASLDTCPECKEPRFRGVDSNGNPRPRRRFTYIPFIQRLCDYLANTSMAQTMQYRGNYTHTPGTFKDIFDGQDYQTLCGSPITVDGVPLKSGAMYFGDPRDVALGLSTDGFGIFNRGQATAWPLILFNYNLPPETRFHINNIIPLGIIPGPNKPAIPDSFLIPLLEELYQLARGVHTYDALSRSMFYLHAFLLIIFGDMPAISMLMKMKGVNGLSPCRACTIKAIPIPGDGTNRTHYVPLSTNLAGLGREHEELMMQAKEVDQAPTKAAADNLAKEYGIKGTPILSFLNSIALPQSFPFDFMHIAWENVIKTLVAHWTGDFKGLDQGVEHYELGKAWKTIGAIGATSGPTIPSAYGPRIPDVSQKGSYMSADMWTFWTKFLAPILLRKAFKKPEYFEHFIDLVELFNICLQFEISKVEVDWLRTGFKRWVQGYERSVFPQTYASIQSHQLPVGYTTKMTQSGYLPAHCQSTHSFTLQTALKPGDQSGATGHFQWSASVGSSSLVFQACATLIPAWIAIFWTG